MSKETKTQKATKVVWVTPEVHKRLRVRAFTENKPIGQLIQELLEKK